MLAHRQREHRPDLRMPHEKPGVEVLHRFEPARLDDRKGFLYQPRMKTGNVIRRIVAVPGIIGRPMFRRPGPF